MDWSHVRCLGVAKSGAWGFVLLAAGLFVCSSPLAADWVWTPEDGWFRPSSEIPPTFEQLSQETQKAFEAGRYQDAARGYEMILEFYPKSDNLESIYRGLVDSYYLGKRYTPALDTIKRLKQLELSASMVAFVLEREYQIGLSFLAGEKRTIWSIPVPSRAYGIDLLNALVADYPNLNTSDDALYHIAKYHQGREQWQQADLVYRRLLRAYPNSEFAGIAEFQIGVTLMKRLKGVEYDHTLLREAELRFNRYTDLYPGGDKEREAFEKLAEIRRLKAEKLLLIAQFYLREKKDYAVRLYLQRILLEYPDSEASDKARQLLEQISGGSR